MRRYVRWLLVILIVLCPVILMSTRYEVTLKKDGSFYNIVGTDYYLDITGYYEYGLKGNAAVLDTATRQISVEQSSFGNKTEIKVYYVWNTYEKIKLPMGTVNSSRMPVDCVFVPVRL
ncbi:MAG: hypothetical protein RBS16_10050 [Candidatus Cloacimonadales bacterium]|nr:hypothetical protein [Candidatus Cloacimonadales bacterium]